MIPSTPVTDALLQAKVFARNVLYPPTEISATKEGANVIHHDYYWFHPSCGCCHSSPVIEKTDKIKKDYFVVAVAAIVIIAASYFVGIDAGKISEANSQIHGLNNRKIEVIDSSDRGKTEAVDVINFQEKMLDLVKTNAKVGIISKAPLIGSAVLGIIGGLAAAPAMVTLALGTGAVSSAALLLRWGYNNADTSMKEKAVDLLRMVDQAEQKIRA